MPIPERVWKRMPSPERVPKSDTKANWIRYRAERHRENGKEATDARRLAERDWVRFYGNTFIIHEYK